MNSEELIGNLLNIGLIEEYDRSFVVYRGLIDHNEVVVTRKIFISSYDRTIKEEWGARIICDKGEFTIEHDDPTPQDVWSFLFDFDESKIDIGLNHYQITLQVTSTEDKVYLEKFFERKGVFLYGTTLVPNTVKVVQYDYS